MKKSYLLLHIAVLLAGFTGVFGKLISLNEGLLVWYRVLFSAIILLFIKRNFLKSAPIGLKERISIGKIGLLITVHWVFFYASIKYSNISIGVVCYCLTSLCTAVFEPLINKKRFSISQLALSALTLLGISLIFHFDTSYRFGIILGVISSAFAALYTVFNERLVKQYDSISINYYQMLAGTLGLGLFLPLYMYYLPIASLVPSLPDFGYLLLLAGFCTVGLYILFAEVLKKLPAFTVNLSFNLEPIYAIVMAFLFFNEGKEVNLYFYIGCCFVITSVILQSVRPSGKKH
ncbi:DMT family transporter [Pedobacter sp. GSP4]|uniref:DMT family transporter n=1 Tax=Pedobacter sp. GSP4 TaxID=3453716 RepID=UPI003EE98AF3